MLSIRSHELNGALCACLVLLCVACTGSSTPAPAPKVLRIGVDLPLTGSEGRAATPALNGITFFVQTHPTMDGFQVVLDARDDVRGGNPDPERGVANVNRFISDPTVVAMIGPFDSAVARKEIPVANAAGLAMVSPATGNPCLTRDVYIPALLNPARTAISCKAAGLPSSADLRPSHSNNFFRLTVTDDLQGAAAADFAYTRLHVLRAAVISDRESYGQGLATAFSARLVNLGGSVLGRIDVDPGGSPDVRDFLARMQADGAQAVYYGGGGGQVCAIRAQMVPLFPAGEETPFLGGDGIAHDRQCVRAAGSNAAGIYATVPIADATTLSSATAVLHDFKNAFGSSSAYGPYSLVAYDATAVLYAALDRAVRAAGMGLPTRAQVVTELARTSGLAGTMGTLGFDAAGDTTNRVVSVLESPGADAKSAWKPAGAVDYSARLPY